MIDTLVKVLDRVNRIITLGGHVTPRVGRLSALVIAVVFIGGAAVIGSLSTSKVDHNNKIIFEGGVAITDTSKVSHHTLPLKMHDGRRWWHGSDGLYLQNGDAWQKFTLPEGGSLVSISAFMQAHNGSLWFAGVYKGRPVIANFNGKIWRVWDSKTGLGEHGVGSKFAEDTDGGIWIRKSSKNITARGGLDRIQGGNGILHFDGKTWHNYTVGDGLIHNRVYDVVANPKGGVWIATLRGLSYYKDGEWTSHLVDNIPVEEIRSAHVYEGRKIYELFYDQKGTLWAVHGSHRGRTITRSRGGISSFDGTTWTYHDAHAGLPIRASRNIWQTENGDLWFGTHQDDHKVVEARGLVRYKDGMWLRSTGRHGIPSIFIESLIKKEDGSFSIDISGTTSYKPSTDHLITISGKVIDQRDDQPAANMGIWVEYDDGEVHAGTMTDENGRYRVEVTPGVYRVRIASKNATDAVTVNAESEREIDNVDLLLLNSRRISGRVLDTSNNPITNAVVVISDDTSRDKRLSPQVLTTDANGKFEGWQVAGPQATFEVAAKGYAQTARTVENAVEGQINIALKKGITLRGHVIDESGQPVARARVAFGRPPMPRAKYTAPPPLPFHRNTYTDTSGLFILENIDVHKGHIWVTHPDIEIMNQQIVSADSTIKLKIDDKDQAVMDIDIPVKRFRVYSVSGVVSLKKDSVEGLEIRAFPVERSNGPAYPKTDQTDANGVYRLDDLQPGEYRISMSLLKEKEIDGRTKTIHYPVQSRTLVIEDRDVTLNFEPLGDARLTGIATYNGQPVSDVYVSPHILADDPENLVSLGGTETDEEGRFGLRGLPSARIAISFHKTDHLGSGRKLWSKIDTLDLTNKKELRYMAELEMKMEERPTLSLGDMAPEFEAQRLDGSTFRLSDYRGKKAVLIDFWATWCPPCIDEIPTIKRIAETYRDQGLEVVGVSLDREEKALRDFVKEEKLNYVQVFDEEKSDAIAKSYGVWGIPSVFLVDKNGVLNAMKLRGDRTEVAVKALLANDLQTADGNSR
ncbi:MAG: carboxypeptidase regulatory-like domain-containing protein [Candidatus Latescibacteria bacterium]|nr:carboxypeptidase regulatory-like domain-containing protein [Candidatus Latescibacterota bacterium]